MIPYILHVTVILTVCFLFYKLFLQKATFYGLNRWTLLSCLVLSFVLPLLPAPRGWTLDSATFYDLLAGKSAVSGSPAISVPSFDPLPPATTSAPAAHRSSKMKLANTTAGRMHPVTTKPAIISPVSDKVAQLPTATAIPAAAPPPTSHPFSSSLLQGLQLLYYVYCLGLLVFGFKFIMQIFVLFYRSYARPVIRDGRYRIVQTGGERGPCTFANSIFINPSLYDPETFQQILVHEKVHVSGGHTLDILLAELAVVLQWFNPFVWLYRREVENNLEFLTDRSVLEHPHIERLAYQLSLLRVTAPHLPFSITNNYNQSLLKRRIVMMNSQHSPRHTIWKYFVLLPILTALVCTLNKPAALGQSAQTVTTQPPVTTARTQVKAAVAVADTAIRPVKAVASAAANARLTETIPTGDPVNEGTVNIAGTFTSNIGTVTSITGTISVQPNSRVDPAPEDPAVTIADTSLPHFTDNIDLRQGSWFLTVDSDNMEFMLRAQDGENSWQSSFTISKSEINPYPGQGTVEFKLVREAGTMNFKGQFDGEQGFGHFQFQPDQGYYDAIRKMGVEDLDDGREHSFFLLNIKKDFIGMLNRNGYTPIEQREVIGLAARKVDEPFLKYWKGSGVEGADEVHNLYTLKTLHIDPDYVEDLKKAGYTQLTVRQLVSLRRQHIDGNYIRAMSSGSASSITPEELVSYKAMHIDSSYLISLKKAGYDHLDRSEIGALYRAHVTADFIKGFQDAGYSNIPVRTLVWLKLRNASAGDYKSFRSLGYTDLDLNRLSMLRNAGITPEFVNAFHKIGYDNIPVNLLYTLKVSGVDADYVARMKEKGFNSPDLNKYVRLKRDFN
jgi:hypothetical protein